MAHLTRIESRETYEVPRRPHYIMNLRERSITFYLEGREMKDEEEGNVIASLINALNTAEKQIEMLFKAIQESEIDKEYFEDYLEDYPEEEDYKSRYKIEDIKDAIFHAMMRKDEKKISQYVNELNVVTEKTTNAKTL